MSRVQQFKVDKRKQVLRRTKRPSHNLVEQIDLANLIPPVAELPGYHEMSEELYGILEESVRVISDNSFALYRVRFFKTIVTFLHSHLPPTKFPELYKYLGPLGIDRAIALDERFRKVYGTRALLDALASAQEKKAILQGKEIEIPREATSRSVALSVDSTGKLEVKQGPLLDALVGVEADRIRRCSECPRIFWAGRIDKRACGDKCVNRRNVRLWRNRYPQYKLRRVRKAEAAESTGINSQNKTRRGSK